MKGAIGVVFALAVMATGCSQESRSPDAIRHDSASVTAAAKRDTTAVVKGVWDGLRSKGPVNINKASVEQLQTLPGVTPAIADAIVAGRPYESGGDLRRRRVVSKAEYDRIADKVVAK